MYSSLRRMSASDARRFFCVIFFKNKNEEEPPQIPTAECEIDLYDPLVSRLELRGNHASFTITKSTFKAPTVFVKSS